MRQWLFALNSGQMKGLPMSIRIHGTSAYTRLLARDPVALAHARGRSVDAAMRGAALTEARISSRMVQFSTAFRLAENANTARRASRPYPVIEIPAAACSALQLGTESAGFAEKGV